MVKYQESVRKEDRLIGQCSIIFADVFIRLLFFKTIRN